MKMLVKTKLVKSFMEAALCCSLLFCIACSNGNESAGNQSIKKSEITQENRNAHFVTSALEQAYAILELAQLAKSRTEEESVSAQAQKMIDGQICIIDELKNYAFEHRINIPIGAPERARSVVKSLCQETSQNFDHEWLRETSRLNLKLVMDFESYKREATAPVDAVIHESLVTLRVHHDALGKYIATNQLYN